MKCFKYKLTNNSDGNIFFNYRTCETSQVLYQVKLSKNSSKVIWAYENSVELSNFYSNSVTIQNEGSLLQSSSCPSCDGSDWINYDTNICVKNEFFPVTRNQRKSFRVDDLYVGCSINANVKGNLLYSTYDKTGNGQYTNITLSPGVNSSMFFSSSNADYYVTPFYWYELNKCIDNTSLSGQKTYYIVILAHTTFRIMVDGEMIVDYSGPIKACEYIRIYPITLGPGKHAFSVAYLNLNNLNNGGSQGIKCNVFDNTLEEILTAQSRFDLNIVFTTQVTYSTDDTWTQYYPINPSIGDCNFVKGVLTKKPNTNTHTMNLVLCDGTIKNLPVSTNGVPIGWTRYFCVSEISTTPPDLWTFTKVDNCGTPLCPPGQYYDSCTSSCTRKLYCISFCNLGFEGCDTYLMCNCTPSIQFYTLSSVLSVGQKLYNDIKLTSPATNGYYYLNNYCYYISGGEITEKKYFRNPCESPTPTPTITPTPTKTPTQTPTNTQTPTITPTPTMTQTPTNSETPTNTPTLTSSMTPTPTPNCDNCVQYFYESNAPFTVSWEECNGVTINSIEATENAPGIWQTYTDCCNTGSSFVSSGSANITFTTQCFICGDTCCFPL